MHSPAVKWNISEEEKLQELLSNCEWVIQTLWVSQQSRWMVLCTPCKNVDCSMAILCEAWKASRFKIRHSGVNKILIEYSITGPLHSWAILNTFGFAGAAFFYSSKGQLNNKCTNRNRYVIKSRPIGAVEIPWSMLAFLSLFIVGVPFIRLGSTMISRTI